jgi:hypothetical protein
VLDTVMPIAKVSATGSTFPGFEGPTALVGTGKTVRIGNLLITVAGRFPHIDELTPIEKQREGILDMTGVGAPYSYGSDCFHLVLSLTPDASASITRCGSWRCAARALWRKRKSTTPRRSTTGLRSLP